MKIIRKYLNIFSYYLPNIKKIYRFLSFRKIVRKNPLFDSQYYLIQNPDVKNEKILALWHYYEYGWKENRNPSAQFDTSFYLSQYSDVKNSGMNPLLHYIKWGCEEGREINGDQKNIKILRNGGIFDEEFYLDNNPDVKNSKIDAATHFYYYGYKEGRAPCPNFNWIFYSL